MFPRAFKFTLPTTRTPMIQQRCATWQAIEEKSVLLWRKNLKETDFNRRFGSISKSRGSNSRVTLRYPMKKLLEQVPPVLHHHIKRSRYFQDDNKNDGFFLITSALERRDDFFVDDPAMEDEEEVWRRLYAMIYQISIAHLDDKFGLKEATKKRVTATMRVVHAEYEAKCSPVVAEKKASSVVKQDRLSNGSSKKKAPPMAKAALNRQESSDF